MKNIYRNWPKSFIAGLSFIKSRDDVLLDHPVYTKSSTELFHTLSSEITAEIAGQDFTGITQDMLFKYHHEARTGDSSLDFIVSTAKALCDSLQISEIFYDIEALSFCLLIVQGRTDCAMKYLHRLIRPAVMLYRLQDCAHFTGKRGGKPRHKLYGESMALAGEFLRRNPQATGPSVAKSVRNKLLVNFDRPPAEETIRKWLRKI